MSTPSSPELHFQAAGAAKNGAIKRILSEWKAMQNDEGKYGYQAKPSEDDIFEWHFMFHGPPDTDFSGGVYTGRINLPGEYPFKPPEIRILTPNGRFELNKKICLSISNYHPEHWQPSWDIRTIITALIAFMPSEGQGAIGSLDYPPEDRRRLAAASHQFVHPMFDTAEFVTTVAVPTSLPQIDVKAGNVSEPRQPAAPGEATSSEQEAATPKEQPTEEEDADRGQEETAPVQAMPEPVLTHRMGFLEALAALLTALLVALILKKMYL